MKKTLFMSLLITLLILSFAACTLHVPYDWDWDTRTYRVILKIDPDDAEVLVNGKLMGYAYEFSGSQTALRLATRNNELVIKKEGYLEELIDLYDYYTRRITIRRTLKKDKDYTEPAPKAPKTPIADKPPKAPKLEPKAPKPVPKPETETYEEPQPDVEPVEVILHILPDEAAIYLDGRFWGLSPKSGVIENLRLKPGKYTLEVVKPGYRTYIKKLYVADQKLKLIIKLDKK
jgi:hypothetical protein